MNYSGLCTLINKGLFTNVVGSKKLQLVYLICNAQIPNTGHLGIEIQNVVRSMKTFDFATSTREFVQATSCN